MELTQKNSDLLLVGFCFLFIGFILVGFSGWNAEQKYNKCAIQYNNVSKALFEKQWSGQPGMQKVPSEVNISGILSVRKESR